MKRKIDVIVLAKDFVEDLEDTIMNLALIGFLCILGIQYISGNRWLYKYKLLQIYMNNIYIWYIYAIYILYICYIYIYIYAIW